MRLLSIDFDFFFPNPLDGGDAKRSDALLYDWGHKESRFFIDILWPTRAAGFVRNGLPLPGLTGEQEGFWGRYRFNEGAVATVHESHAYICSHPGFWDMEEVVNYDAHHDCGYNVDREEVLSRGEIHCDTWGIFAEEAGIELTTVYPSWKGRDQEVAPSTLEHFFLTDDEPLALEKEPFDGLFVCRSGAWVPSWLDDEFDRFLEACPVPIISKGLTDRSFDRAEVDAYVEQTNKMMAQVSATDS